MVVQMVGKEQEDFWRCCYRPSEASSQNHIKCDQLVCCHFFGGWEFYWFSRGFAGTFDTNLRGSCLNLVLCFSFFFAGQFP